MRNLRFRLIRICLLSLVPALWWCSSQVWAQQEDGLFATLNSRYIISSDVERVSGEVEITESEFELKYADKLFDEMPVAVSLNVKHIDIVDDVDVDLPTHLEGMSLGLSAKVPVPFMDLDYYFIGLDIFPSMYTDDMGWEDSAFRIPVQAYVIYKESDDFIVVAGLSIRPDYDQQVLPIIGFIYKPNDRLTFNLTSKDPKILYELDDNLTAFAEFDYVNEEYEVTRASQDGVVLKHRESSMGFGLQYLVDDTVEASASVGSVFARRLEYRDGVGKVEPEAGIYLKAQVSYKF
ncbi:MAG: hypothetical protein KAJ18_11215 [Candidatus Omnitrophica bacterium]|nr:hypothetical protein [Candidatus Omnitrophota bacterium]